MQAHQVRATIRRKAARRRGRGGKRGSYSGRGIKGQKARAGRRIRPQLRDVLKKLPKRRGHGKGRAKSLGAPKRIEIVNVEELEKNFEANAVISPKILVERGLVRKVSEKIPKVKILGRGTLSKPLEIQNCALSKSVREMVIKAGGRVQP